MNRLTKENETLGLVIKDCISSNYEKTSGKINSKDLNDYVREQMKEMIGFSKDDKYQQGDLFKAYRRNKTAIFELIENVITLTISENLDNSPFVQQFAEVHNVSLGEKETFYSDEGLLSVASFAGNHWDTDRQVVGTSEFSLPTEWVYIRVYEDIERFLLGLYDLSRLTDKVNRSMTKYINDRVYAEFQNISTSIPSDFTATGNTEDALGNVVDIVEAATGSNSVIIAGTHGALRKLTNIIPDKRFAETTKSLIAGTGSLGSWEGNEVLVIPQVLNSGTFTTKLDNSKLYIIAGDENIKPIKIAYYGDTRTYDFNDGKPFTDQTAELQVQTKIGMGLVAQAGAIGSFTFQ